MNKIICIGNRLAEEDSYAMEVYDLLLSREIPCNIKLIEGGVAGLNLLSELENVGNVVFVDTVSGFDDSGSVIIVEWHEIAECLNDPHYGHGSGIAYLLQVLPLVCDGTMPESVHLVGLEGKCSTEMVEIASKAAIDIACNGSPDSYLKASGSCRQV